MVSAERKKKALPGPKPNLTCPWDMPPSVEKPVWAAPPKMIFDSDDDLELMEVETIDWDDCPEVVVNHTKFRKTPIPNMSSNSRSDSVSSRATSPSVLKGSLNPEVVVNRTKFGKMPMPNTSSNSRSDSGSSWATSPSVPKGSSLNTDTDLELMDVEYLDWDECSDVVANHSETPQMPMSNSNASSVSVWAMYSSGPKGPPNMANDMELLSVESIDWEDCPDVVVNHTESPKNPKSNPSSSSWSDSVSAWSMSPSMPKRALNVEPDLELMDIESLDWEDEHL